MWVPLSANQTVTEKFPGLLGHSEAYQVNFEVAGTPKIYANGESDLQWGFEFPEGTRVQDNVKGSFYTVGGDQRSREAVEALGQIADFEKSPLAAEKAAIDYYSGMADSRIIALFGVAFLGVSYLGIRWYTAKSPSQRQSRKRGQIL